MGPKKTMIIKIETISPPAIRGKFLKTDFHAERRLADGVSKGISLVAKPLAVVEMEGVGASSGSVCWAGFRRRMKLAMRL